MTTGGFSEQRQRLMEQVLDRACSDQSFRQQLISNPKQALESAGLAQQAEQAYQASQSEDVSGYSWGWGWSCSLWSW